MIFLLDHLPSFSLITLTGLAGLSLSTVSTLLGNRRAILLAQALAGSAFMVHYMLLGATTGMLMAVLGFVQLAVACQDRRPRWMSVLFGATVPAALLVAAATWQGPMSALSATGFVLQTVGRWQPSVTAMRLFFLAATVMGAGHNILAGSAFGLCSDTLAISGYLLSLWRGQAARGGVRGTVAAA
ncbi:YgjV family protein [Azospirillum sp. SYSU D00513]|uniref:YgjV family protein n=1 Tax=Azospirillum sp. SYSU D00513 TaxID=2812561 RepID=UPI001A97D2E8|nr:YgjV family protein [Azospirillum sp. SYSU D00513]